MAYTDRQPGKDTGKQTETGRKTGRQADSEADRQAQKADRRMKQLDRQKEREKVKYRKYCWSVCQFVSRSTGGQTTRHGLNQPIVYSTVIVSTLTLPIL